MDTDTGTAKAKAVANGPNEMEPNDRTIAQNITLKKPQNMIKSAKKLRIRNLVKKFENSLTNRIKRLESMSFIMPRTTFA
jgi:precorrin-6B methylase 2